MSLVDKTIVNKGNEFIFCWVIKIVEDLIPKNKAESKPSRKERLTRTQILFGEQLHTFLG
jgi:hypothetical protein